MAGLFRPHATPEMLAPDSRSADIAGGQGDLAEPLLLATCVLALALLKGSRLVRSATSAFS